MKKFKKFLLIAFLGMMSFNLAAAPCSCRDNAIFQGLNAPFHYGINQATFFGGFNFITCNEGTVTFTWDFGDGNTYTQVHSGNYNPSTGTTYSTNSNHTYAVGGTYQVCLTVSYNFQHPMPGGYSDNCSTTNCTTITVEHPCDGNEADFHILNYSDSKKRFIDISKVNETSEIVAQTWNIDGQIFTGRFVDYIFSSPGTYDVCLEVIYIDESTGQCCIQNICQSVVITESATACSLDPDFSYSCFTDDCIFKFTGSAGSSNRNIKSWSWDFGDGRTGQGQNIFHTYENPGTYDICLTIVGENGGECCYEEYCRTIDFNCNGIDLLSLPSCDNGGSSGGGGASNRIKSTGNDLTNILNVYPNPSSNNINLEMDVVQDQQVRIELIDINGKRVPLKENLTIKEGQSKTELNIGNYATGVYTLSVTGETFYETKVIVIK